MKTVVILLFSLLGTKSIAQITSIWRGNAPGHETEWNYPSNWTRNDVPDEFTDVIIPFNNSSRQAYPVLEGQRIEINSLSMLPGAIIILDDCELTVFNVDRSVFRENQIMGTGKLLLDKTAPRTLKERDSRKLISLTK